LKLFRESDVSVCTDISDSSKKGNEII